MSAVCNPVGDPLGDGVVPRRLGRIPRLIVAPPEVHPNRPAGRQVLGDH